MGQLAVPWAREPEVNECRTPKALGSGAGGVAPLACFLEGGVLGGELGAHVVQHLLCEAQQTHGQLYRLLQGRQLLP